MFLKRVDDRVHRLLRLVIARLEGDYLIGLLFKELQESAVVFLDVEIFQLGDEAADHGADLAKVFVADIGQGLIREIGHFFLRSRAVGHNRVGIMDIDFLREIVNHLLLFRREPDILDLLRGAGALRGHDRFRSSSRSRSGLDLGGSRSRSSLVLDCSLGGLNLCSGLSGSFCLRLCSGFCLRLCGSFRLRLRGGFRGSLGSSFRLSLSSSFLRLRGGFFSLCDHVIHCNFRTSFLPECEPDRSRRRNCLVKNVISRHSKTSFGRFIFK